MEVNRPGGVRVSVTVPVSAEPSELWNRLLAWEDQPRWMVDAISVRVVTRHREGPGVRIAVRTKVMGIPMLTDVLQVVTWQPPARLEMVRRGFVRGRGRWVLHPSTTGTRFTWEEELRVPIPVLGELALLLYRPVMRRLMRRSLERFAALQ